MKLWIVVAVMLLGLTVFAVTRGKPASSVPEKETQTLTATVGERTPVVVEFSLRKDVRVVRPLTTRSRSSSGRNRSRVRKSSRSPSM